MGKLSFGSRKTIISLPNRPRGAVKWVLAKTPSVKTNWDAASDKEGKKRGPSIIIRDTFGQTLACLSSSYTSSPDPILAECETLKRALIFYEELGLDRVEFEGDTKYVIDIILQKDKCNTQFGSLMEDLEYLLQRQPLWSLHFIHREGNNAAHRLAKLCLTLDEERVWIEEFPPVISTAILANFTY